MIWRANNRPKSGLRAARRDRAIRLINTSTCSWAGLIVCLSTACAAAQEELPTDRLLRSLHPTADVNDFASLLTNSEKAGLENRCKELREKTGAQLAVVTVKSLEGGQIDDFAVHLFKNWGIGEKEKKNGVLLLVAIKDRKARLEVGYGLEPILPDALAGRILNEQLFHAFRQQRYAAGLDAAVARIAEIIEKNEPAPANLRQPGGQIDRFSLVLFLALFVAAGSFMTGAGLARQAGCLIPFGLLFAAIPFLIGFAVAFPIAPFLDIAIGAIAALVGYRIGKDNRRGPRQGSPWDWNWIPGGSTWDWGSSVGSSSWTSGGFSGGGSDWGGFGGGSSGGGGASGGW